MKTQIREATLEDYEPICALFSELDAFHSRTLPGVFQPPSQPARSQEYIREALSSKEAAIFVAEHEESLIGLIHVVLSASRDIPILVPRRYAFIDTLCVKEEFRSKGIGKALIEKAHKWSLQKDVSVVQLNVWEFNRQAIDFYEKLGYTTASRVMWRALK